ncbi:MAG: hypothetical protein JRJ70_05005 [Deltaproteobacteria bacterium]|nr:hypothetical protein [Deltaproteobacteria bacterium]
MNLLAAMAVSLRGYLLTAWIAGMGFVDVQRRKTAEKKVTWCFECPEFP